MDFLINVSREELEKLSLPILHENAFKHLNEKFPCPRRLLGRTGNFSVLGDAENGR